MRKKILLGFSLLLALAAGCSREELVYPPVKMEFVSVSSNDRGRLESLLPDKGPLLQIVDDRTSTTVAPDTVMRVITNYEQATDDSAILYAIGSVLSHEPEPRDSEIFKDGIKTDPIALEAGWMGRGYLNLVLLMKVREKIHYFQFVEDSVEENAYRKVVTLSLYHDASGDNEGYTQNVYASVPLQKYASSTKKTEVIFRYRSEKGEMVEIGPYIYKN